jgi:tRNA threonylcarbamoyladenosine biosynthesis protein TsaB
MAQQVLAEAGMDFPWIDMFAVTIGPGAFTGLRIGLAAARGMALASGRPLAGVSTFDAVAHGLPPEEREGRSVLVAVESRREDIFVQLFDSELIPVGEARSVRPQDIVLPDTPVLVAGDGAARLHSLFGVSAGNGGVATRPDVRFASGAGYPNAADVARLVASRGADAAGTAPPQPFYLRPPDVTLPAGKSR